MKRAGLRRCIAMTMFFVLLEFPLANCCTAAELKQKTIEAFDHYVRVTDARVEAELRPLSGLPNSNTRSSPTVRNSRLARATAIFGV